MKPIAVGDDIWAVSLVPPGSPLLVDRTGTRRIATTDPITRTIAISADTVPPLLDAVVLHEAAHAITISYGLLPISADDIEEWSAWFLEKYAIEAIIAASESLGRPLCVKGYCM